MKVKSIGYNLLTEYLRIPYLLFYRKVKVIGEENIPKNKPIILAPNHQNALMDPLAMIFSVPKQIVFLARGDIFKGNFLVSLLNFGKILPVYRQRDGKEALKKNDKVFQDSVDYISKNGAFCLFPETQHNPHRNLKPLKKGIPRIAFQALKASNYDIDIQIIPTGIYYENKDESQSYIQIKYGEPISVKDYIESVKENEKKAMAELSQDMTPKIKALIMDVPEDENYDLKEQIRSYYSDHWMKLQKIKCSDQNRFLSDQSLIDALHDNLLTDDLRSKMKRLCYLRSKHNWNIETVVQPISVAVILVKFILLLLLLPISVYGIIINILPFMISSFIKRKVLKDPQFKSTINFVVGAVIMPIYFFLISLLSWIFVEAYQVIILFFSTMVLSYFSYLYLKSYRLLVNQISFLFSADKSEIENIKSEIYSVLDTSLAKS